MTCGCSPGRPPSGSTTGTTSSRSSGVGACGTSVRSGSFSPRARSNGRSSSRTTTGPGSCSPAPPGGTSSAARGSSCSRTTTPRSGSPARRSSTPGRAGSSSTRSARTASRASSSTTARALPCDVLAVSGGWSPAVHLWTQRGGRLRFDERSAAFVPDGGPAGVEVVGKAAGAGLPEVEPLWLVPGDETVSFVDLERDSTVADVRRAVGAGLRSIEHVKRYTTIGTGSEQGKTGRRERDRGRRAAARRLAGRARHDHLPSAVRPRLLRAARGAKSRRAVRPRARDADPPVARRPRCGLRERRPVEAPPVLPARRRVDGARPSCASAPPHASGVAAMDASTLGKIDVQGPDAAELLNRLYTNAYDTLAVGKCRYGVMCKPDGMVFDDGVVMRIGEERYICTTTTGNAAPVLAWMEEWLQTEWPELRVWLTSVTEQWATVAVVGPDSRALLGAADRDPARQRELPLHGDPGGGGGRDPGAGLPHQLLRGARLRGERRRPPRPRALGSRDVEPARSRRTGPRRCTFSAPRRATRSSARRPTAPSRRTTSAWSWIVSATKRDFMGKRSFSRADTCARRPQAPRRPASGRPGRARSRGRAARRRPGPSRPDPDARPRHLELPQRRARAHVRACARRERPRADRPDRPRAASRPHDRGRDRRRRSLRPGGSSPRWPP